MGGGGWRTAFLRAVVAEEPDGQCRDWPFPISPRTGYPTRTSFEGRYRQVGQIVLELSGRPKPFPEAHTRHSCDRRICVAPWHLSWGTAKENGQDKVDRNRQAMGVRNGQSKLTEADVREIRRRSAAGETRQAVAETFGIAPQLVSRIARREAWRHVARRYPESSRISRNS